MQLSNIVFSKQVGVWLQSKRVKSYRITMFSSPSSDEFQQSFSRMPDRYKSLWRFDQRHIHALNLLCIIGPIARPIIDIVIPWLNFIHIIIFRIRCCWVSIWHFVHGKFICHGRSQAPSLNDLVCDGRYQGKDNQYSNDCTPNYPQFLSTVTWLLNLLGAGLTVRQANIATGPER